MLSLDTLDMLVVLHAALRAEQAVTGQAAPRYVLTHRTADGILTEEVHGSCEMIANRIERGEKLTQITGHEDDAGLITKWLHISRCI